MQRRNLLQAVAAAALPSGVVLNAQKAQVKIVSKQELSAPFAEMEATTLEVTIPPGVSSNAHRHGGMVFGYVLEGEYRFAINGQPPRLLQVGETFHEPAGATHSTSANASSTKTARILAIIVAEKGKELTTPV